jgi:hypothetical protein
LGDGAVGGARSARSDGQPISISGSGRPSLGKGARPPEATDAMGVAVEEDPPEPLQGSGRRQGRPWARQCR